MLNKVRNYIEKHALLTVGKPVIVGFSGGADSVALLDILNRLGYPSIAAHCNFHLRDEESERDEQFACKIAATYQIPFRKTDFQTITYAKEKHISIEMAARELRYQWFETLRQEYNAQAIAVAHHQDDQAETVLINLTRGTGVKGLRGMLPRNGYIIRPLLNISKQEIGTWLEKRELSFVTDSTNLSDVYTRNFIRLKVIPLLEKINPSAKSNIARSARHMAGTEALYKYVIEEARKKIFHTESRLSIPALLHFPAPETVLYELLKPYGFNRFICHDIIEGLSGEPGKEFYASNYKLTKDRTDLILTPIEEMLQQTFLLEEDEIWDLPVKLSYNRIVISTDFNIEKNRNIAYFDYNKLSFPLILRTWQPGDWFIPFGMNGRKKLSDYFTDRKVSRPEKEKTWVLCNGNDIIWIVGERVDNRYRIDKQTTCVLRIKFSAK